jgi:hypothetical protein
MGAGTVFWYRVVSSHRQTKREVLTSGRGRFHDDPENEPTSYVANSLDTAWLGVKAHAGEARLNTRGFQAWRIAIPDRVARKLVDLRTREQQEKYHITQTDLETDPASDSGTVLASRLRREGKTGIIYRSVRDQPSGVCVALFLESIAADLSVEPATDEWERFIRAGGAEKSKTEKG